MTNQSLEMTQQITDAVNSNAIAISTLAKLNWEGFTPLDMVAYLAETTRPTVGVSFAPEVLGGSWGRG
jgi:hypothetical protein